MKKTLPWLVIAFELGLLAAYFAAAKTGLGLSEWIGSFGWAPETAAFSLPRFALVVLLSASSAAVYAAWIFIAWATGAILLEKLGWEGERWEATLISVGLGLGILALAVFLLGACGLLNGAAVFALGAALVAADVWGLLRFGPPELPGLPGRVLARPENGPLRLILLLCIAGGAFHIAGVLLPPVSFDEMNYQLSLPKLYIINGGFVPTPFNHLSFLPRNMGMLFALGLLSGGATAAKLFSWGMGVLGGAAILVFARPRLGARAAFLGAAIFLLAPVVANQLRVAGADLGTAFYELLAVFLLLDWIDAPRPKTLLLSSVFWGLALGCKYTALPGFFACGAVFLFYARSRPRLGRGVALYALPALVLWSPWLVKNWLDCGNPVAPLLSTLIPSRNFYFAGAYQPMVDYTVGLGIENYFPIRGLSDLLRLPWSLTVSHNDFNHDLGPVFLMCLPLWALADRRRLPRWIRILFFLCSLYWLAWLAVSVRMTRYFVAGLGLTSLLCGWLLAQATAGRSRAFAWTLFAPFIFGMTQQTMRAVWIQNLYKKPWGYLSGRCGVADYLHALQPDSPINAELFINKRLPMDSKILVFNEFRTFYLDRNFLASTPWDHDYWHELVRLSRDPDDFIARARSLGLTHILINDNYVLNNVGMPLLHPGSWTQEDRQKGFMLLQKCAWPIFRDEGVWVARLLPPSQMPHPKMPEVKL